MRTTKKLALVSTLIAFSCVLWAGSVNSQPLPPVPEGGLYHYNAGECTDDVSGEDGYCIMSMDMAGNHYLTFKQDEQIMFIRQITADGYETIYIHDRFNSF